NEGVLDDDIVVAGPAEGVDADLQGVKEFAVDQVIVEVGRRGALVADQRGGMFLRVVPLALGANGLATPGLQQAVPGATVVLPPYRLQVQAVESRVAHGRGLNQCTGGPLPPQLASYLP